MQFNIIRKNTLYVERRALECRREQHVKSFFYSIYKARRQTVRRKSLNESYHTDFYKRWVGMIVISITCLSAADAFFTLKILDKGGVEVNPVMAALLDVNDSVFVIGKLFITVACLLITLVHINIHFLGIFPVRHILSLLLGLYGLLISYQIYLLSL